MNCYLGNVHVSPIVRLLSTYNSDGVNNSISEDQEFYTEGGGRGRLNKRYKAKKSKSSDEFVFDYIKLS